MDAKQAADDAAHLLTGDLHEDLPVDHAAASATARRLAERYRLEFVDMDQFRIDGELFRSIPAGPDAALRVRPVAARRPRAGHRRIRPDGSADDRRAVGAARDAPQGDGRRRRRDPGDSEEERELAAGARAGHRRLRAPAAEGGRGRRRQPDRRAAHQRHQPGDPPGGLDDLPRPPEPRQRHPHRDPGRRGAREVPDRRRAAAGDAADREAVPLARSSRASRSWPSSTSPRSACRRTAASSCACPARPSTSASRSCRACTAKMPSSASSTRSRSASSSPSCASTSWDSRNRSCDGSASTSPSPTAWCW